MEGAQTLVSVSVLFKGVKPHSWCELSLGSVSGAWIQYCGCTT